MSSVVLKVGAVPYAGWKRIEINRSLETVAGAFTLGVTEFWPGRQEKAAIHEGDECALTIDGEVVITGFVDEGAPEYDDQTHEVEISGRDRTGDIVDCCAVVPTFSFLGQTLLQAAGTLCAPFGIIVYADVDVGAPIPLLAWQPDDKVYAVLERAARHRGVLLVSDGQGGMVITRPGTAGQNSVLRLGKNILSARGRRSFRNRFSQYTVLGQTSGGDDIAAETAAGVVGSAGDPAITRYRPLVITGEEPSADLSIFNTRALWEASVRAARGRRATITVQGWRDATGALWAPNKLVSVGDDYLDLHEEMLISGVNLTLDERGERAEITVTGKSAFDPQPLPPESDVDLGR